MLKGFPGVCWQPCQTLCSVLQSILYLSASRAPVTWAVNCPCVMGEKTNGEIAQDQEVEPGVCLTPKWCSFSAPRSVFRELGEGKVGAGTLPEAHPFSKPKAPTVHQTLCDAAGF